MMTLSPRLVTAFPALLRTLGLLALLCVAMLPTSHAWAQEGVATVRLDSVETPLAARVDDVGVLVEWAQAGEDVDADLARGMAELEIGRAHV